MKVSTISKKTTRKHSSKQGKKQKEREKRIFRITIIIAILLLIIGVVSGVIQDLLTGIAIQFSRGNLWTYVYIVTVICIALFFIFAVSLNETRKKEKKAQLSTDRLVFIFVLLAALFIFAGLITQALFFMLDELFKDSIPSAFFRYLIIVVIVLFAGWLILRYAFQFKSETLKRRVV